MHTVGRCCPSNNACAWGYSCSVRCFGSNSRTLGSRRGGSPSARRSFVPLPGSHAHTSCFLLLRLQSRSSTRSVYIAVHRPIVGRLLFSVAARHLMTPRWITSIDTTDLREFSERYCARQKRKTSFALQLRMFLQSRLQAASIVWQLQHRRFVFPDASTLPHHPCRTNKGSSFRSRASLHCFAPSNMSFAQHFSMAAVSLNSDIDHINPMEADPGPISQSSVMRLARPLRRCQAMSTSFEGLA